MERRQLLEELRSLKARIEKRPPPGSSSWQGYAAAVDDLRARVREWLQAAEQEGLVRLENEEFELDSEPGHYVVEGLVIALPGDRAVQLRPIARSVVGAMGRVDLVAGPKRIPLLLGEGGEWQVAVRRPAERTRPPLTEKLFTKLLVELAE